MRHLPNLLSGLRLLCTVPLALWILDGQDARALYLLVFAGLTDLLDGFLAKRFGWQSAVGAWLDPAADKLLALVVLACLFVVDALPLWFVLVVVGRDLILALGSLAFHWFVRTLKPEPNVLGRSAVFAQTLFLAFVLLDRGLVPVADRSLWWMANIATVLTLASGVDYVIRFIQKTRAAWRENATENGRTPDVR
ncbi:MAG: CDP-alcohol phosphatidyltransferase family protein [Ahniella sp.]|nr:CDP-alcohol phosphatidyltransferase family protein [Ahniella sp.]